MEEKRKTHTSTAVKRRYNDKAYKKITVQVKPELAEQIAAYRAAEGLSMAQFLQLALHALDRLPSLECEVSDMKDKFKAMERDVAALQKAQ